MNKAFEKIIDELKQKSIIVDDDAGHRAVEIIEQMAKEYNGGWIPCSERLPNNFTDCLVTLENGAVFQAKYIIDEFKMVCEHEVTGFYKNNNVIAWQPLPQPYKERE